MNKLSRRARRSACVLASAVALTACGSGEGSGKDTTVTVAVSPFAVFALPWVAKDAHYFADEGLKVEFKSVSGGTTAMVPWCRATGWTSVPPRAPTSCRPS